MTKSTIKFTLLSLVAFALAAMPLQAADKPEKAEGKPNKAEGAAKPAKAIPFRGKLASKTDSSITVGARTFEVTAETKIMKDDKEATLADATVGEQVRGSYTQADDKLTAKSIFIGAKPQAPGQEKKEAKPKKGEAGE